MRWVKTTITSVWGAVGMRSVPSQSEIEARTENIRETMLEVMGDPGHEHSPRLMRRISYAQDLEALWYLRSDWMGTLAATQGESAAAGHVRKLNIMFEGLLPGGLQSRPSPFGPTQ